MTTLFERHRPTLQAALDAAAKRGGCPVCPELPSGKSYTRPPSGKALADHATRHFGCHRLQHFPHLEQLSGPLRKPRDRQYDRRQAASGAILPLAIAVEIIRLVVTEEGFSAITALIIEQNTFGALSVADRGYVMETGRITLSGPATELIADERIRAAYLGM